MINSLPHNAIQHGLLVATTACALFTFSRPANLALRTIALLTSGSQAAENWLNENRLGRFALCAKIGTVALALIAVIGASSFFIKASLVSDIALQSLCFGRELFTQFNFQRLAIIAIDSFALASAISLSWPLMVIAATVHTVVMLEMAGNAIEEQEEWTGILKFSCYLILSGVGLRMAMHAVKQPADPLLPIGGTAIPLEKGVLPLI